MNTIFIDLARISGYAIYNSDSGEIICFATKEFKGAEFGTKLMACSNWLQDIIQKYNITQIVVENCYIPVAKENKNTLAFKRLAEYHGIVEAISYKLSIPYEAVEASAHHISLLGYQSRKWKRTQIKEETINRVRCMGYQVQNDNEADAISLVRYWCKRHQQLIKLPNGHTA